MCFGLFGRRGGVENSGRTTLGNCLQKPSVVASPVSLVRVCLTPLLGSHGGIDCPRLCSRQQFHSIEGPHAPCRKPQLPLRGTSLHDAQRYKEDEHWHQPSVNRQHFPFFRTEFSPRH